MRIIVLTAFFSWTPAPKLNFPDGMGRTLGSVIGSDMGSVGISSSDSRKIALNIAMSNLATHCSMTYQRVILLKTNTSLEYLECIYSLNLPRASIKNRRCSSAGTPKKIRINNFGET
jgi:hypothetical protein